MAAIVALDQSVISCGWALLDGGHTESGAWNLADGIASRAAAFLELHRQLQALHKRRPIGTVVYEAPVKTPKDKVDKLLALYGVAAHIESWCRARQVQCPDPIDQRHWRKTFLGEGYQKGNDRERVKRMAVERAQQYGFDPLTDDEAEAIGLLDHFVLLRKVTPPWRVAHPFQTMV